jgi:lipopolysaccharide export system protein LptA
MRCWISVLGCILVGLAFSARAAIPEAFLNLGQGNDLELQADQGIEWRQQEQRYVARGNVVLRKGVMTLKAQEVGAKYDTIQGKTTVRKLFASGGFRVMTDRETLTGGKAVYDLAKSHLRITGGPIRLITPEQRASADDSFEYWGNARRAVIRGNATVTQDGNTLKADTLTLFLEPQSPGSHKLRIRRAEANGNVLITTPQESLSGESGFYDATAGIVRINNRVMLKRGGHALEGSDAEVNLKTGVSTLENRSTDGGRVRGVLRLDELEKDKKP